MHFTSGLRAASLALSSLSLLPAAALAQGGPLDPSQRNWLQLQVLSASTRTTAALDSVFGSGLGSDLQVESELGQTDHKALLQLAVGRRIAERWRIEGDYLELRRNGRATLTRDVQVNAINYTAGSQVDSDSQLQILRLGAGYSLLLRPDAELGIGFGWIINQFDLGVSGAAGATHQNGDSGLPTLGLYGSIALGSGWRLAGRVEGMRLKSDERNANVSLQARWQLLPNLGLGAGWRHQEGRFVYENGFISGTTERTRLSYRISGPQLVLDASF